MRYCLDSNTYIEAHRRYYAFDIAPGFWDALTHLAEQKIISSPMPVYNEIANSTDELARWARNSKKDLFVDMDDTTQDVYSGIVELVVRLYEPQHVQVFLRGADPWVIAYAKAHTLRVVAMESHKQEQVNPRTGLINTRIKIPNICQRIDVKYTDTFALLRKEGIVLR